MDFSIRVYAEPEVAEACLALQERHGADINVVLFCLWIADCGRGRLPRSQLGDLLEEIAEWRDDLIVPLRALRSRLKEGVVGVSEEHSEIVRSAVKRAELDAEHVEQLQLAGRTPGERDQDIKPEAAAMDAAENLAQYLSLLKVRSSAHEQAWVASLLSAAFPAVPPDKITILSRFET